MAVCMDCLDCQCSSLILPIWWKTRTFLVRVVTEEAHRCSLLQLKTFQCSMYSNCSITLNNPLTEEAKVNHAIGCIYLWYIQTMFVVISPNNCRQLDTTIKIYFPNTEESIFWWINNCITHKCLDKLNIWFYVMLSCHSSTTFLSN